LVKHEQEKADREELMNETRISLQVSEKRINQLESVNNLYLK